jgi:hypothetical protein
MEMFETGKQMETVLEGAADKVAKRIEDKDLIRRVADYIGAREVAGQIDLEIDDTLALCLRAFGK